MRKKKCVPRVISFVMSICLTASGVGGMVPSMTAKAAEAETVQSQESVVLSEASAEPMEEPQSDETEAPLTGQTDLSENQTEAVSESDSELSSSVVETEKSKSGDLRAGEDADTIFGNLKTDINGDVHEGWVPGTYTNNYQSMEEEPFTFKSGTGTATVNNGMSMAVNSLKDNLFIATLDKSPYMANGIIDTTFSFKSEKERVGFIIKSSDDYKGISIRYDVTSTTDSTKASWVIQNQNDDTWDSFTGPALSQNTEYRMRIGFCGKRLVVAVDNQIIYDKENGSVMTDKAVSTSGQFGLFKWFSSEATMVLKNINISGMGSQTKPSTIYKQNFEDQNYVPNWTSSKVAVEATDTGNKVLRIPAGQGRIFDNDAPEIKEGTLSLRYKAIAPAGSEPKQFGFRFGVNSTNDKFRELNWDGGRWVVESQKGYPGIEMQKPLSGTWNDLTINFKEGEVTVFLNKEEVGTYALNELKESVAGKFGIRTWGNTAVLIDDVVYTSEVVAPEAVIKYENDFQDGITSQWSNGTPSIVSEGSNQLLKLSGLSGLTELSDSHGVELAQGTYLIKVKPENADIGFQFGKAKIEYSGDKWKATYNGVTKEFTSAVRDANILAPNVRAWNNIGMKVMENEIILSINGKTASAVFEESLNEKGYLGIISTKDIYVDDICYTEQFLDLSTTPVDKMNYAEYYETIADLNWDNMTGTTIDKGYLTGTISGETSALNKSVSVADNGVYQVKLQANQASAGMLLGNIAIYNTSDKDWKLLDTKTGNTQTLGTSDVIGANTDYIIRAEIVKGTMEVSVNGKLVGTADLSGIFDKTAGGFGIYNPNKTSLNVKIDAMAAEEIQIYDEKFETGYQADWSLSVAADANNKVTYNETEGNLTVTAGGVAKFLNKGSLRMNNFHAAFDVTPSVNDDSNGGRYGFLFKANDFTDGFSVDVDINGSWRVNVNDNATTFGTAYSMKANTKYHVQIDAVGNTVQLKFTDPTGKVTDMGSVTVNGLPDTAGYFGARSWYGGKSLTFDNIEMIEEPALETFKLTEKTDVIKNTDLTVTMDKEFPRIISYSVKEKTMQGEQKQIDSVLINGKSLIPTVESKKVNNTTMEYTMSFAEQQVTIKAVYTAEKNNVVNFKVTEIKEDGDFKVRTFSFGENNWAYSDDRLVNASYAWETSSGQWHGVSEELADHMSDMKKSETVGSTMAMISGDGLAATIENNVMSGGNKVILQKTAKELVKKTQLRNGIWTYRHESSDSTEELPWAKIAITEDMNADNIVDWQDGAVAHRKYILKEAYGAEDMANNMMYISFNFASQANDPFLNTLETGKVLYNYMDGFGQMILHKGYQAEGHDDDIPSYSNIGVRQGGAEEMRTLIEEGTKYNLSIGVHLNATEYHLDANELYYDNLTGATAAGYKSDSLSGGWDWIDNSYYVDQTKDVLTGQLESRLKGLYDLTKTEHGALDFYYIDVYTGNDYNAFKLTQYINNLGLKAGTEFSGPIEPGVTFTHWGTDLGYPNKGNKSTLSRMVKNNLDIFVGNALYKGQKIPVVDTWGDSKTDVQQGVTVFYNEVLPTKFMQHFGVLKSETDKITFEENVVSQRNKENGKVELSKDGKIISSWADTGTTTDEGERHAGQALSLIPWTWNMGTGEKVGINDGAKLYHWNPTGGVSEWELTDEFKNIASFDLYETTQQGKVKVKTISNLGGKITIEAKKNTSYVLYPSTSAKVLAAAGNWGEGSPVKDFAFNAEAFAPEKGGVWAKTGDASIEVVPGRTEYSIEKEMTENRWNRYAQFKTEGGTLTQTMTDLIPGEDYTVGVWTEAQNGRKASIEVTIGDQTYSNYVTGKDGIHQTSFKYVGTKWQRMDVEFKVPAGVTEAVVKLSANAGNGTVSFDDVKVWKHTTKETDVNNSKYLIFEDFENTYEGWGPFEYGGGSRQISITTDRSNENDNNPIVSAGTGQVGPVMTWVLDGENSLKFNETAVGKQIVTNEAGLKLEPNTTYDLSFDYTVERGADYVVFVKPVSQNGDAAKAPFIDHDNQKNITLSHTATTGDKKTKATFNGTFTTGNAEDYQIYIYESNILVKDANTSVYTLILDNFAVSHNSATELPLLQEMYNLYKDYIQGDYAEETPGAWKTFDEARKAAKALIDAGNGTGTEYHNACAALKSAADQLVLLNQGDLEEAIKKAEALDSKLYSTLSFSRVTAALTEAKKTDPQDTQAAAKAVKALQDAMDKLVNIVSATKAVAEAKSVTNENYTVNSWTIFQDAITTVENLIANDAELTQTALDAAAARISAAKEALTVKASDALIGQLRAFYNQYVGKDGNYSKNSFAGVKAVLPEIEKLLADTANVTEQTANAVLTKANGAAKLLTNVVNAKQAVTDARRVTNSGYTAASWDVFQKAIAEVERLMSEDKNLTQTVLDAAVSKLTAAQKALKVRANTTNLKTEYNRCKSLNLKQYTDKSVSKVKALYSKIDAILKNANASQSEIDSLYSQLSKARKALVKKTVTSVKFNVSKKTLGAKEKLKLTVKVSPTGADAGKLKFTSSNTKAATVNSKGVVTAKSNIKKAVKTIITVKTAKGKKATCTITVKPAPKKVQLSAGTTTVKVKKTLKLKTTLTKGSAGTVTYTSSNQKVATVDSKGKVKGIKKGKAVITAKTYNGKSFKLTIRVK